MAVIRLVPFGGAHDFSLSQVEQHNVGVGADRPELIDPKVRSTMAASSKPPATAP